MIIVTGTARFGEGEIERLRDALAENVAATRAEAGCSHYAYAVDLSDPNLLHVTEWWEDQESMKAHMATPHMAKLMATLGEAKIEGLSIKAYDAEFRGNVLGSD